MPDPIKNEETETRIHSLCLFDVANITVLNRCAHCPGAARAALQHRRCPLDASQPNIFHPVVPESSKISAESESASSSKGKGKLHYEVDTLLSDQAAALTLGDSSTAPSIQQSETSCGKRKADLESDEYAKGKKKTSVSIESYSHLSKDYLQMKPQKLFQDLDFENLFVPNSRRLSPDFDWTSFPGNLPSGSFVPGCIMDTDVEGRGVFACKDGMGEMDWQCNSEI